MCPSNKDLEYRKINQDTCYSDILCTEVFRMKLASPAPKRSLEKLQRAIQPLTGAAADFDPLLELIGNARFVLLGEATHGTREFYKFRANLTKRLIQEKQFTVVAWEADWPDALRL